MDVDDEAVEKEGLGLQFCAEWCAAHERLGRRVQTICLCSNNILYAHEDRAQRRLMYACRNCPYQIEATSSLVYRNVLKHSRACVARGV